MSDYSPTDWVDFETPVDAAHLDKMEAGILAADEAADTAQTTADAAQADATAAQAAADAAQVTADAAQPQSEKAQANGYASLDSGGKVPLAQLPEVGAQLTYEGDHVPATSYQDGDVVVKDGIAYLCVGGPTTVAPDPAPWGAAALAKVAYGTSLPASPVDGQEAILVDSLTNPSYQWRFRYNAGSSSAYKWEFVGGSAATVFGGEDPGLMTNTTPQLIATPAFVVPRAGLYLAEFGAFMQSYATTQFDMFIDITDGTNHSPTPMRFTPVAQFNGANVMYAESRTPLAGITLQMRHWGSNANQRALAPRWIKVTPIRVS